MYEGPAGEALAARLERQTALPVHQALRLIAGVVDGLAAAHAVRIYHSALTPTSVLVGDEWVRIIDFGLAELGGGREEGGRSSPATNLRDRGPADVLAVGLLFEELLGGTHAPPSRILSELPHGRGGGVLHEAEPSLRRARSPYWSQRPHMEELAAALAPALEWAPVPEGEELGIVPVPHDPVVPAPAEAPLAPPPRSTPVAPSAPARPAAAETPAEPSAPARPAAAESHRGSAAEEPPGSGRAVIRRTRVLMLAAAVAVVAIGVVTLMPSSDPPGEERSGPPPSGAAQVSPSTSASGVIVPDVLGLSAMEARRMLAEAGLVVTDADPAPGVPGEVVGTDPPSSQIVAAGTSITLLVGASPERLEPTAYVNGPGGYAFRTPSSWELREVGPLAEIVSPNGDIVITFERRARGSLEEASERLVASLLETRSNSELVGQRRELIANSPALLVSGTATEDTGEAIRFLAITVRGEPRSYAISIIVPAGSNPEQVLPRIEEIVTSFRTLDAEDS